MADTESVSPRRAGALPLPDCVALVLQGGGALGSYQAGVIEALDAAGIAIDWVAGISIGAINAAIVAGNPPGRRVERLHRFWDMVSSTLPTPLIPPGDRAREWAHEWSAAQVVWAGVPGFFSPRPFPPAFALPGTPDALSFYDTTPLRRTLNELIDWKLLNHGPIRLAVGAVDIENGNFRYFDTKEMELDVRHIMASGALPPGFPPVEIDGRHYWDGGIVSNTPLTHVLDHQDQAMLVFQVDLFPATGELPRTLGNVFAREKEIRYSSRTRAVSDERMRNQQIHEKIRTLLDKLPPELAADPDAQALATLASKPPLSLVQLIYRANSWEGGARDFEFSELSMEDHWHAGREAVAETMANAQIVASNILDGRSAAFDLTRR